MAAPNLHIHFVAEGKGYDLDLLPAIEKTDQSVTIDGRHYQVIGETSQIEELRKRIPALNAGVSKGVLTEKLTLDEAPSITSLPQVEAMDQYLSFMEREKYFRGVVLVKKGGERIFFKAYGKAALDRKNIPSTRFCIGSVGKMFTATAIMFLIRNEKFKIDSKINDLLPQKYKNQKWEDVTVRHLLTHTSGIPSYGGDAEDEKRENVFLLDELVELFSEEKTAFLPGAMNEYSNSNYILLGAIIENVTGMPYGKYLQEAIFGPLKMDCTTMFDSYDENKDANGFVLGSGAEEVTIKKMPIHLSKSFSAGGGIISTAEDLEKWAEALSNDAFLSSELRKQMFLSEGMIIYDPGNFSYDVDDKGKASPKKEIEYPKSYYGFGFCVAGDKMELVYHPGAIAGSNSAFAYNTETKDCFIVLNNMEVGDIPPEDSALGVERELEEILS